MENRFKKKDTKNN